MNKRALRQHYKTLRQQLPDERRQQATDTLVNRLPELLDVSRPLCVAGYLPVHGELDCRPVLHLLAQTAHVTLALPVIVPGTKQLLFRRWDGAPESLVAGTYGIAVPAADTALVIPDIVLVPALAYTSRGYRLGYGGGYYDATLAALSVHSIGLAYQESRAGTLPLYSSDIPVDTVLFC